MAEVKKVTVYKNGVTMIIEANLVKDFTANGWVVRKEYTNPYATTSSYKK